MTRRMRRASWQDRAAVLVVLLAVAAGFCLLHFDHHGTSATGMCPDPCSMMASSPVVGLMAGLFLVAFLIREKAPSFSAVSLHLLDPPPETWTLV
jgi:hypothetical protein